MLPSKASLALVFCLAYGSAVMSLPVLESRSHNHAGGVATVVTQTTTTTTTVTAAVAVDDKHHHHHHHNNGTVATVDPAQQNTAAESTPAHSSADTSTTPPPSLEARGWFYDLFHPKKKQRPVPEGAKLSNNDANQKTQFTSGVQVAERDYFDDDLDLW
ncbi:hypothetical protein D9619_012241 [Psilocybe cf. subviscida]|uniref:Uncharacterized protein n=1 Tax=Psilocybe cf. subviscida TaxID=2480587 RepID=A0A8H5EZN2_9AGAR|nr:hypothetical protein D9619_012241 [Psilocybe cf. subviscida]